MVTGTALLWIGFTAMRDEAQGKGWPQPPSL